MAHDYYVLTTTKRSVAIIALSQDNRILVTKEYRHPTNTVVLGCPGGLVHEDESFIEAAHRELLEETGCEGSSYEHLGTCYPLPGLLDQIMAIVFVQNSEIKKASSLEPQELIEFDFVEPKLLKRKILEESAVDAVLCTAFLFALLHHPSLLET
jgi:8-oxo-dGTP pyrophosphatase MutT (NUDIX family)